MDVGGSAGSVAVRLAVAAVIAAHRWFDQTGAIGIAADEHQQARVARVQCVGRVSSADGAIEAALLLVSCDRVANQCAQLRVGHVHDSVI
jgi:hypothetical protein